MNPLIVYPLMFLIIIGGFYQLINVSNTIDFSRSINSSTTLTQNQTVNGTEQDFGVEGGELNIEFTMTVGIITIIAGAILLGLIGINILGSGLSPQSVKIIWNGIVYYGLWAIFSALGFAVFYMIPYFGMFIWFGLTAIYSLGVFDKMGSSGAD